MIEGKIFAIDETGSTIAMTRDTAWAPRGEGVEDVIPRNRGSVVTVIGALTEEGLGPLMTVEGGTTAEVFEAYVEHVLAPELQPGDLVLLDNLGAHRTPRVRALIQAKGAKVWFTPPYSPDLNPIELAWAKVKRFLRTAKARTREGLNNALAMAASLVTSQDSAGWWRKCGFHLRT